MVFLNLGTAEPGHFEIVSKISGFRESHLPRAKVTNGGRCDVVSRRTF